VSRYDVLNLETTAIDAWWDKAVDGLARGLTLLRDDCGVITPAWLPYQPLLMPMAAALAKVPPSGGPDDGAQRQKLVRWIWCAVFGQAYENSANSQTAKDLVELLAWLAGGPPPETVTGFRFDPRVLRETTPRQRSMYRGTMCLVLSLGPRDFHSGAKLTGDLMIEHNIDDHHVFPYAYLGKYEVATRVRDCVLNRTLIDRKTNHKISDRAPSDYMEDIRGALGPDMFQGLLRSHRLPGEIDSPLWHDDFEAFLDWRQATLWEEIKRVTGASEAADLVAEEATA
jgi:hypothetical protein